MQEFHPISSSEINWTTIQSILDRKKKLKLSGESIENISKCRAYLDQKLSDTKESLYGINTGFGSLCDKVISFEDLGLLQKNLVISHACGVGEEVPPQIIRLMLFLKLQSLSYGNSGVQLKTVQRLVDMYNHDILPVVYQYGSLGASGDLAPLAHLCLPMLGMGEVTYKGERISGSE